MSERVELPAESAGRAVVRYVRFSEEVGETICSRVAGGESLAAVCKGAAMPHPTTVYAWAESRPGFGAALTRAQAQARVAQRLADRARAAAKFAAGRDNRGRWSTYTPEIGEEICRRIADGVTLKAIGADPAMPCAATVLNWVREFPEFGERYALARAQLADLLFDEAREVALGATPASVWADRLRFDTIRWMAARMAPRKYCERVIVEQEVAARLAEEAEAAGIGGDTLVILKKWSDVTAEEEAEAEATERLYEQRRAARARLRRGGRIG
ncbi:MAG TPA: hypothetical protein VFE18_13270 [Phenylobacterium sp.]|jgi:hypothetical protein|uniref:terminase small subunit-like protein n=1 Tax=Phenylobacterium sp. TaxID=1871053 RepID=UPI002D6B7825|nr:hypothetical protein [Phenylobacterium sp.]HZZ69137.1 hypothetical protein [Phenylobacterium sp.]